METTHASDDCEFFSPSCNPASFWLYLGMSLALVTTAGLMAGLTMGLVSLDMLNMRILEMEGSPLEKQRAAKIIPIISRHHLLLVTLLLMNAGANEALPIFLSKLVPESVSIILSVTCVLVFGEIVPAAMFTGPNQLGIAASLTPVVKGLMMITSPISYPIAKVLDCWLGDDHQLARYKRQEIKALVALQRETEVLQHTIKKERRRRRSRKQKASRKNGGEDSLHKDDDHLETDYQRLDDDNDRNTLDSRSSSEAQYEKSGQGTRLHVDEVTIIHGALDLTSKTVRDVMIPIEQVYMLEYNTKLGENAMAEILASGHSRIPIYKDHPANIVGLLLVKRLIVVDPEDARRVCELALRKPIVVSPEESCYHVLNEFQKGRSHIALVTDHADLVMQCWQDGVDIPAEVSFVGIITIEDVIEELIQEEIEDESDVYVHGVVDYWRTKAAKRAANTAKALAGRPTFVQSRLKVLAERARVRVKNRKAKRQLGLPTTPTTQPAASQIEIRIDSGTQPAPSAA